jgi:hypothetical protein
MSRNTKRILISFLIISAVVCLCIGTIGAAGLVIYNFVPISRASSPVLPPGERVIPPSGDPGSELPQEIFQQMLEIEGQVSQLRGLEAVEDVSRALLTREELRQRVLDDFLEDYTAEEAGDDIIELYAFGLLEMDYDLYALYLDLYSEQVAGFYDFDEKAMYIIQDAGFLGPQRMTYAHEFVHALQDMHYQISENLNFNDEACELDSERCAAVQALLEGDASLAEEQWFLAHSTQQDRRELRQFYNDYESPVFDQAPSFLREAFLFPYIEGGAFVQYLYNQGGWEAVDGAYRDLPASTEQIMHPELYPHDQPIEVNLPDLQPSLGEGWRQISDNILGELFTYLVLAHGQDEHARLEDSEAREAAAGWGGDRYAVYYNDNSSEILLVLRTVWDDETEADEFSDAFLGHYSQRFGRPGTGQGTVYEWRGDDHSTHFSQAGAQTTWVYSNNPDLAIQIAFEIATIQ